MFIFLITITLFIIKMHIKIKHTLYQIRNLDKSVLVIYPSFSVTYYLVMVNY